MLGTNQTKIAAGRSVVNHGNKGRPFRLALPRADYCDNSAERFFVNASKEGRRAKIVCLFLSPVIFNSFSNTVYLCSTRTKISACKPNVKLIRLAPSI